jgi:hypothetical protein
MEMLDAVDFEVGVDDPILRSRAHPGAAHMVAACIRIGVLCDVRVVGPFIEEHAA